MKTTFLSFFFLFLSFGLFALNPSRTYKQLPDKFNMKYEATVVKVKTGGYLHTWYIPANKKTTRLVLISHNGEGNMGDHLRKVQAFNNMGYNALIFDYRGFGESSDFEIDNNAFIYPHFQDDLIAVLNHAKGKTKEPITLYGFGPGAGLAFGIGYKNKDIDKIIADTPFLSMEDLEYRGKKVAPNMTVPKKGYLSVYEPINSVQDAPANPKLQVMLVVNSKEALYSAEDYTKLVNKHVSKNIYVVENPDRKDNLSIDNFQVAPEEFAKKIESFLAAGTQIRKR